MRDKQQGGEPLPEQLFLGYTPSLRAWAKFITGSSVGKILIKIPSELEGIGEMRFSFFVFLGRLIEWDTEFLNRLVLKFYLMRKETVGMNPQVYSHSNVSPESFMFFYLTLSLSEYWDWNYTFPEENIY